MTTSSVHHRALELSRALLVSLSVYLLLATASPAAASSGRCSTAEDCSLNGDCLPGGQCSCRPPWTGSANCDQLRFLPTPTAPAYPAPGHNATTWGGSVARGDDGLYHMFVSEMVNNCGLDAWTANSRCSHVVSRTALGPYTFRNVAVDVWCHNPAIVVERNTTSGALTWVLFHMGDGTPRRPVQNCTGPRPSTAAAAAARGSLKPASPRSPGADGGQYMYTVSGLHVAASPDGPFERVNLSVANCNNPSPVRHPNGTWFLVCHHYDVYRAASFRGPWTKVPTELGPLPNGDGAEDPYLWIDVAGNFHVMFHASRRGPDEDNCLAGHAGAVVAAHIFSRDGLRWNMSSTPPYTNVLALAGGRQQVVATRERPKFIFDAGTPAYLINGIAQGASCAPTPCINCKLQLWDTTNISPLDLISEFQFEY